MQTMPNERPSLARMLSCRHSKKVSCETLSVNDVFLHNNLQFEAQSFYYSDGEKDLMGNDSPAGDADESSNPNSNYCNLAHGYLQHARELEKLQSGKLDNPSYGNGKAAGDNFLSRFFPKVSHMPAASRAKEVERLRKHLRKGRKHPGAIRHTGGVLPHSAPILLHIGSYSGAPNSKGPATLRASSIIPRNAVSHKMNASAGEPFSPKVSCLGRVRNKQKHLGKCTSVTSNYTKDNQVSVCCTSVLSRRKKKTRAEVSRKEKKTSGKAMVGDHPLAQSKKTDREKALQILTAQSSGGKGTMSSRFVAKEESKIWSLMKIMKHGESKVSHQHQESWQGTEASAPGGFSSEFSVDLSRFGSESQRRHASIEASSVGNGSQRFEQDDKEGSVQAPPQNALLLIRSRKANDEPEVASSSERPAASTNAQESSILEALDDHAMIKAAGTQFYLPTSSVHTYAEDVLPLPEVEMKKPATIADILGYTSSLTTQGASATTCKCEKFEKRCSLPTEHSGGHRQASLPKPYPEARIWQRRASEQPCALDIKRPIKVELNLRTTM